MMIEKDREHLSLAPSEDKTPVFDTILTTTKSKTDLNHRKNRTPCSIYWCSLLNIYIYSHIFYISINPRLPVNYYIFNLYMTNLAL